MKKTKQISYLSAIIIAIGSTIGAGIFFKNGTIFNNVGGSLAMAIAAWVVAGFGIIAFGLSLVEVSRSGKSNSGFLSWIRQLCGPKSTKYSSAYMLLVYLPLNYFAMPIYLVFTLQDAISLVNPSFLFTAWEDIAIAFGIFIWFSFMGYLKLKIAEKVQWVFTVIKYLPLIAIPIIAAIAVGDTGVVTHVTNASTTGFTSISPWLGIFASIPAILFAIDGFYTVTSLREDMKEKNRLGSVIVVALSVIIATYITYSVIVGLSGTGYGGLPLIVNNPWLGSLMSVLIIIAIMGIINGFGMSTYKMYESEAKIGNANYIIIIKDKFKFKNVTAAAFYTSLLFGILFFLIMSLIAIYGFNGSAQTISRYGFAAGIYDITDMLTDFSSLLVFMFIGWAIWGGIMNRRTNKVKLAKSKYFLVTAWIAVIFIAFGAIYVYTAAAVDMSGFRGADQKDAIIKFSIMVVSVIIPLLTIIPWKGHKGNKVKINNKTT